MNDSLPSVRVMHVLFSLRSGGMEHGVVKLVNGLDPSRVRSAICSTTPGGALKEQVGAGVPVFELHRRAGNNPMLVWRLCRLFRSERPDIVHTHAWGTLIEGLLAARLAGVPAVVHGEHGTLQLRAYQRWCQRRAWSVADQVLSVSSRLAERISQATGFPADRIRTIRNGVDLSRFSGLDRSRARAELGIHPDALVAVSVGRLVPVKDHVTLLEAIGAARVLLPGIIALVAGDGPLQDRLARHAAALGLENVVRFLGHREDVETLLAAADLFVSSSASEGLSNTILEAMAAGLPVVATSVGGADELVGEGLTGRLVPAGSPDVMAKAIVSVLGDAHTRQSMGRAGRARAEAQFGLTEMIHRYEALYCEVARRKRRTPAPASSSAPDAGQAEPAR